MARLTDAINARLKSPVIKKMLAAVEAQATATARAAFLGEVLARQDRAFKTGIGSLLPDDFLLNLKHDKATEEKKAEMSQAEALKASAMLEIETLAQGAGAPSPSLIALSLADSVSAEVDKNGAFNIFFSDPKTGSPILNPKTGTRFTPGEYLVSMRNSEEFGFLFDAGTIPRNQGSAIGNPWRKETFNLTEQGRITKTDPNLAARLKAEAGK